MTECNKISHYDSTHKKIFYLNNKDLTAYEFVRYAVDDSWYYSMYWNKENWPQKAKKDCAERIEYIKAELADLEQAQRILERIEDE